jgi:iron complex outermembrane receptor protein
MKNIIIPLLVLATFSELFSQKSDTLKTNQLKEVEIAIVKSENEKPVSIGKLAIKPMDLPQSVAFIDKEVLDQQQTIRMSDALKNFNGVYLMGTTGGYQEEIAGRGFLLYQ